MKQYSACSFCVYYYKDIEDEFETCHYESLFGDDDDFDPCKDAEDAARSMAKFEYENDERSYM